ncbi:DUF3931 domain-containing protein [Bacillus tropicus]|uniref:DUF3931 domain-containing protein n=3 Tax=Bacillus cereus group TaxID=86661 RepID=A0A5M9GIS4_9BACI|nr:MULTISPECIES: DUF3931 domain-containing protein [Bacillus]ACJ82204.1 hypothetical protein BCAH187_A1742 [Bacillus cereus AH187]EDZ58146.1 hypothetical protein BCH308197_1613 [Bacillus cereus H3081.97]EEL01370.1 hypothetical protein bcere0013_14870 [Bacillus cereus BDRD-ST26]EJP96609.1 hypothetical protein IAU_01921 [Bacillus cereus IS075]EJQ09351.1 hypothetical protein IC5_00706 [Bacillus cereus AND1407]EJR13454.1 hypothetical protein II7_02634 [Bacillus cereus MSX-A12]EOO84913.1 hypothet
MDNNEKKCNVISIDGKKKKSDTYSHPKLVVENKTYEFSSFVLCGETPDGRRLVLTHMISTDEFAGFVKSLDTVLQKKIERIFFS